MPEYEDQDQQAAHDDFVSWAKQLGLDDETIQAITEFCWDYPLDDFELIRHHHETNYYEAHGHEQGFIIIGLCPGVTGDFIAVDYRDEIGSVWYICRNLVPGASLQEVSVRVGDNLYDVLNDIEDMYDGEGEFPGDYYDAKQRFDL